MTIEDTIQIGYGCGLTMLDEAYSQIMSHYDCFFLISDFAAQRAAYDKLFIDAGLTTVTGDNELQHIIKPLLITDVAKQLGYELQELILPEPTTEVMDTCSCFKSVFEETK